MLHEGQGGVTIAPATELRPVGSARYRNTATFIEYFRARNRTAITDDQFTLYLSRPRCVAASHALYSGHLTQNAATWYVRQDLQELFQVRLDRTRHWSFPERCVELVTHAARLFYLPANNRDRPRHDAALVKTLCHTYKSDRGLIDPTIWRVRVARFATGPASLLHDTSPIYRETREFDEYLAYWRASNMRTVESLLTNRRFCAGIEALGLRLTHNGKVLPILSALDETFSEVLRPLFPRLRHRFYAKLAAEVEFGLIELPRGLRNEFSVYDVTYR
jgi:hypothetical protein